ncbi:DUF4261 domain-containing protein [Ruminococcus sp. HUN007]|uniref:DUF4261 domain-containing protein n=1 Tax=Ruminococcus sp. HUN007 TaxID=1514668 RepID=UPI0005D20AF2|nr:DUF4261 domain-containing protein [Ruminococcus sp. HUN007]
MKSNYKAKTASAQYEQQSNVFEMWLLFKDKPVRPEEPVLRAALESKCGKVDVIASSPELTSFGVKRFMSHFRDADLPAQVMLGNVMPFRQTDITNAERAQIRDIKDRDTFLSSCTHKILAADMMAALDTEHRTRLLMNWLEVVTDIFKDCVAVWIPSGGKLIPADLIRSGKVEKQDRFVCFCVNARFFKIEKTDEMLVDTHGMCAVGLPDIQCHFKNLDADAVVNYVYNIASFVMQSRDQIKDGDTIEGLNAETSEFDENVLWTVRYEDAMVQPMRAVIDVCPGENAAGEREK